MHKIQLIEIILVNFRMGGNVVCFCQNQYKKMKKKTKCISLINTVKKILQCLADYILCENYKFQYEENLRKCCKNIAVFQLYNE